MLKKKSPQKRFLSLWFPEFSINRLERQLAKCQNKRQKKEGEGPPRALYAHAKNKWHIINPDKAARAAGVFQGQNLADARAQCPALALYPYDENGERQLLRNLCVWATRYTPLVACNEPDGLMLDITGCTHLFNGEVPFLQSCFNQFGALGFQCHMAIADTIGAAWGYARFSPLAAYSSLKHQSILAANPTEIGKEEGNLPILAKGQQDALLALPVLALRIDGAIAEALRQIGLRYIADISQHPRAPFTARFGSILWKRIDQMLGREEEILSPFIPCPPLSFERCLLEPLSSDEGICHILSQLAGDIASQLACRGKGASRFEATLYHIDGRFIRFTLATSRPIADGKVISERLQQKFSHLNHKIDIQDGFDVIRLSASDMSRCDPCQSDMMEYKGAPTELCDLIDRLGMRYGRENVLCMQKRDRHLPEQAQCFSPAFRKVPTIGQSMQENDRPRAMIAHGLSVAEPEKKRDGERRKAREEREQNGKLIYQKGAATKENQIPVVANSNLFSLPSQSSQAISARAKPGKDWPRPAILKREEGLKKKESWANFSSDFSSDLSRPLRPLRLLSPAEPVEGIALLPEGPLRRFIWRHMTYLVRTSEGPERVAPIWWREAGMGLPDDAASGQIRDYYSVEDDHGRRFWLYRKGFYGQRFYSQGLYGQGAGISRWFIHGIYA